jgi:hypothetical protein
MHLAEALGKGSDVKGFDTGLVSAMDDSLDHLEIYAEFLGEDEFNKAKDSYDRTLDTME